MFKGRSVIEVMILAFTGIVLIVMLMLAGFIFIVEIKSEGAADTNRSVDGLMSLVSGILGALLGLIAGKSTATNGDTTSIAQLPPGATVTKTTTLAPSETSTVIEETQQ